MMMTWRYTLPAFLVPFAFVLTPNGQALLGQGPITVVLLMAVSAVAVAALAMATGGLSGPVERLLATVAAVLLLFLEPVPIAGRAALCWAVAAAVHLFRRRMRFSVKRIMALFGVAVLIAGLRGAVGGSGGGAAGTGCRSPPVAPPAVYYVYGGGLAKQLSANIANTQATASVTWTSIENIKLLATGKADIGFSQSDTAADAVNGTGSFTEKQGIKALARI